MIPPARAPNRPPYARTEARQPTAVRRNWATARSDHQGPPGTGEPCPGLGWPHQGGQDGQGDADVPGRRTRAAEGLQTVPEPLSRAVTVSEQGRQVGECSQDRLGQHPHEERHAKSIQGPAGPDCHRRNVAPRDQEEPRRSRQHRPPPGRGLRPPHRSKDRQAHHAGRPGVEAEAGRGREPQDGGGHASDPRGQDGQDRQGQTGGAPSECPGGSSIGPRLDADAGHGRPEEHHGGQEGQPAPPEEHDVEMGGSAREVPRAREDAGPDEPSQHGAVEERPVGSLVHPNHPSEPGGQGRPTQAPETEVGEEDHGGDHSGAHRHRPSLPRRDPPQHGQHTGVDDDRLPPRRATVLVGEGPGEMIRQAQHQVREHPERE